MTFVRLLWDDLGQSRDIIEISEALISHPLLIAERCIHLIKSLRHKLAYLMRHLTISSTLCL